MNNNGKYWGEKMQYSENLVGSIFENMINGFAYHKIILDESGQPIDYLYLDINASFEKFTGLKRETTIGRTIREVVPEIIKDRFNWIQVYGDVALTQKSIVIEQCSEALNKWFLINAFSPEYGYFVTTFIDITDLKMKEVTLEEKNEELGQFYEEITASEEELRLQIETLQDFHEKLQKTQKREGRASKLAKVGSWELYLATREFIPSEHSCHLIGINPVATLPITGFRSLVFQEDHAKLDVAMSDLVLHDIPYDVKFKIKRARDGETIHFHSIAEKICDEFGATVKIVGAFQDITEIVLYQQDLKEKNEEMTALYEEIYASEEELRQQFDELKLHKELLQLSKSKYKTLVDNASDLIYSIDCEGKFTAVNRQFCEQFQVVYEEVVGKKIDEFLHIRNEAFKRWIENIQQVISQKTAVDFEESMIIADKVSYIHITLSPIINEHNEVIGITGLNHDITYLKENEEKIRRMGFHDPLTDLPNRTLFFDRLKIAIENARRMETKVAVLFFDMDNFKRINDTLGHYTGDQLLIETANRIKACMREYDTVARLSGDEFSVLLYNIHDMDDLLPIVHRIQEKLSHPFLLSEAIIDLTTSIGIALFPNDGNSPEELLRHADTAMYKAKEHGRNTYRFFNYEMKDEMIKKIELEKLLKKAVKNKEFVLHFQPQFRANQRQLRGFECLIRWNSPELGFVSPLSFIGTAEETGIIIDIGEWVVQEACRMIKKIQTQYQIDLIFSVNISLVQLRQKGFDQMLLNNLEASKINPSCLELEITESMFIENWDVAIEVLNKVKDLGVRIALDDFGTGYSSLSYLKKIPISLLKIDKAFVDEIDSLNPQRDLTDPIISLVHKLGIETIAEGIETLEQLEYLTRVNCDNFQGFYLGRPVPEIEAEEIIRTNLS